MPQTDSRRICGPEESIPLPESNAPKASLLNEEQKRWDGRNFDTARPIFMQCGTVTEASGSAYLEMGQTKVICSVYGPRENVRRRDFHMKGQLTCEFKFAAYACKRRRGYMQDAEEREFSKVVVQSLAPAVCLEKFPKAKVDIFIIVLEDGGNALASAISCASVALADAAVEMYDLVPAMSVVCHDSIYLVDPTQREDVSTAESDGEVSPRLTLAIMPTSNEVTGLLQTGRMQAHQAVQAMKVAGEACLRVHQVQRQCILDRLSKSSSKS